MAGRHWNEVVLASVNEHGQFASKFPYPITLSIEKTGNGAKLTAKKDGHGGSSMLVSATTEVARLGRTGIIVTLENESDSTLIRFLDEPDCRQASSLLKEYTSQDRKSVFTERTDKDSAVQYFQFYSYLSQQQNMMQDYVRTNTYQTAMLANTADFIGKVVLDVGAGSGILSFFAVQAGAKKVYAVEASNMAQYCERLVKHNNLSDRICVIPAKIEETELPELVDTIISEPIGYMLFNERMIETYLHAKKFLKPGGKMFPTEGHMYIAPFNDDALFQEQSSKPNFWSHQSFHGVDLGCLRMDSFEETFKQPIVDTFHITSCLAPANKYPCDFLTVNEQDLYVIDVPLLFNISSTGYIHGLAFWFDLAFKGSSETIWISTSPTEPLTHWYQVRCLLKSPVYVKQGQNITARLTMRANSRQSYDVEISVDIPGTASKSTNTLDLKNPYFRYGGQVVPAVPQDSTNSPTDNYYATNGFQTNMVNTKAPPAHDQQIQNLANFTAVSISGGPPINPGCIPSVGMNSHPLANRTSIGAGVAPSNFTQPAVASSNFDLSNQYMIGDYVANLNNSSRQ
ncbi:histone-arginine methyltransferase CARMER-like [Watersipora subatra]|uniref:histone-arginine methyltransferase CARMER-like n=1 Tax=Watersipora subatra TaxID=2589382 RepID=UPI00355AE736